MNITGRKVSRHHSVKTESDCA